MKTFARMAALVSRVATLLTFCVSAPALALTAPKNLSPGTAKTPYTTVDGIAIPFNWGSVSGATSYELVVNEASTNIRYLKISTPDTNYFGDLPPSKTYVWKVHACSSANVCSLYSTAVGIQTKALTLADFSVNCDATTINEGKISNCSATATLSDNSTLTVTANAGLRLNPVVAFASISSQTGILEAKQVTADKTVIVSGSYSYNGGTAKSASTTVTIKDIPTVTDLKVSCLPAEVNELGSTTCSAAATFSNSTTSVDVTKDTKWSLADDKYASINGGKLSTTLVPSDQVVTVMGSYSFNGATAVQSTKKLTIKNKVAVLALMSDGRGTGNVLCNNTACSSTYAIGTEISLEAVDGADSVFKRWIVSGCAAELKKCKVKMTDDIKGSVTFDHKDTVAFARMREDVPHVGMHVFSIKPWELVEGADSQSDTVQTYPYTYKDAAALFAKYPGKIKATANLIKKSLRDQNGGIQVLTNAAPVPGKYKGYQLAVQIDFTLHQFILFGKQFSLERLKSVIEEWQQEGFAVHLLLNTSSAPNTDKLKNDSRGNPLFWSNENWSALRENKDVYYGGEFIPYRPCLTAKEGQRPCIYDTIVSSFLKPTIDYLVESKVAEKLAVIYIFNEFDYPGPVNPKVRPGSLEDLIAGKMPSQEKNVENWKTKWASRKEICGGLSAADCRAQSLANTTKRALAVARTASKGKVPIGVKLIDFSIYSAYNSLLLRKELLNDGILADPTQGDPGIVGVIGVDCYWHKKT